jgi:hydroxyacylglutathione hydrolase
MMNCIIRQEELSMPPTELQITPIPAFNDNYVWLLQAGGRDCVVVDPGDAAPVLEVLKARELRLGAILLTHHHADHAGGVPALLAQFEVPVYGPDDDRLGDWCSPCREGDRVSLPQLGVELEVLDIPAHTRSHIAFHGHGLLFSGDTLFSIGCGRIFEGTPDDLQVALDKLAALPAQTRVYCGHEYTQANCRFALLVEPDNPDLQRKAAQVGVLRAAGQCTLPAVLGEELQANPFLRSRVPAVVSAARRLDPDATPGAAVLGVIRAWKDRS